MRVFYAHQLQGANYNHLMLRNRIELFKLFGIRMDPLNFSVLRSSLCKPIIILVPILAPWSITCCTNECLLYCHWVEKYYLDFCWCSCIVCVSLLCRYLCLIYYFVEGRTWLRSRFINCFSAISIRSVAETFGRLHEVALFIYKNYYEWYMWVKLLNGLDFPFLLLLLLLHQHLMLICIYVYVWSETTIATAATI